MPIVCSIYGSIYLNFVQGLPWNQALFKVLEEACLKEEYEIDKFVLRHHNRVLDLDLPLRWAGLTNNATVEMVLANRFKVPVGKSVEVTLQVSFFFWYQEWWNFEIVLNCTYKWTYNYSNKFHKSCDKFWVFLFVSLNLNCNLLFFLIQ